MRPCGVVLFAGEEVCVELVGLDRALIQDADRRLRVVAAGWDRDGPVVRDGYEDILLLQAPLEASVRRRIVMGGGGSSKKRVVVMAM